MERDVEEREAKSVRTERGILWATAGLLVALVIAALLRLTGVAATTLGEWLLTLGVTLVLQGFLWLLLRRGWDRPVRRIDPHFVYLPMAVATLIFCLHLYLSPEARDLVLMAWFVSLLFVTGIAGWSEVVVVSALMAVGYLAAMALRAHQGMAISLVREMVVAGVVLIIGLFAGLVMERIRRGQREMKALRRELRRLSRTDYLTGLPNRRHFEDTLTTELARCRRYGGTCTLAILDVDRFKQYNDRHGHLAGDEVLRAIGRLLVSELRAGDVAARYGGEEFAVVMVSTSKRSALRVLERLRSAVERLGSEGGAGGPTISGGVAAWPDDADQPSDLVRAADAALYRAKHAGRNRVCAAGSAD